MATALFRPGDRPLLNLALVLLTLGTTFVTFLFAFENLWGWAAWAAATAPQLRGAATFALCTVAILGAHEMGHYVLARVHGVDSSLPYFIPLPLLGFGTLGAVIRVRGRIPSRNALVDIGAAGPLAGLAVALPVLFWGCREARVVDALPLESPLSGGGSLLHLAVELFGYARAWLSGVPLEDPGYTQLSTVFGDPPLLLAVRHLALGALPAGKDVLMSPPMLAAWFGLLVTLLNLIPIGQLDGGHVAYAVLGRRARRLGQAVALGLLLLTLFVQWTWVVWLVVASKLVGFHHPEVLDPEAPLSPGRRVVSALCLLALLGCSMPVPISTVWQ